jgi:hypothetical protein
MDHHIKDVSWVIEITHTVNTHVPEQGMVQFWRINLLLVLFAACNRHQVHMKDKGEVESLWNLQLLYIFSTRLQPVPFPVPGSAVHMQCQRKQISP